MSSQAKQAVTAELSAWAADFKLEDAPAEVVERMNAVGMVMVGKTGGVPGSTWATGSRFVRVRENSRPGGTRRRAQPIAQE